MERYTGTVITSYGSWSETNEIEHPDDKMIKKWKKQITENYSKKVPIDIIMNFFKIPQNDRNIISKRDYKIKIDETKLDEEIKAVYFNISLHVKG